MGAEELMIRGLAAYTGKNVGRMFHGYDEEVSAAVTAAEKMGDLPLWLDADTSDVDSILAQIAVMKHRNGIRWAAVDHVGLVQTRQFNTRNDQIGHITGRLKQAAKRLQIPIIALFQLSRLSEKENRPPGLHDLRDSGNIEQDLDVAIFLHVDADQRDKPQRRVHVGVLKNRSGRSGWLKEEFRFDGTTQTFREVSGVNYDQPPPYQDTGVDL
jgi:replicative DNA helicase